MELVWHVGDVVRKVRKAKRITQKRLALKAQVSRSAIINLEDGGRFQSRTLDRIAEVLEMRLPGLYALVPTAQASGAVEVAPTTFPGPERRHRDVGHSPDRRVADRGRQAWQG